jgi:hypothetical protein
LRHLAWDNVIRGGAVTHRILRRVALLTISWLLGAGAWLTAPSLAAAADPDARAAAEHLASENAGRPSDYNLVYERTTEIAGSGERLWVGKLVDQTGRLFVVYRDAAGNTRGPELLSERAADAAAGLTALEAKADLALRKRLEESLPTATVAVGIWLDSDPSAAVNAVVAAHPELTWIDGRPLVSDLASARTLRSELWDARRTVYAAAVDAVESQVEALGGTVAYASTSAPLVYVDLPARQVDALAELPSVLSIGLERTWKPQMTSAAPTVDANWTSGSGDQGSGVRVAVVEYHNVRNSGDLAGRVVASRSTTGTLAYTGAGTFDHPTWVAGAIAGQGSTYRGIAPGSLIVSSGTGGGSLSLSRDRAVIAATDWAISPAGGDADIVNVSLIQDTATGSEEARRFFDSLVDEDLRIAVASAGNYAAAATWNVGSPGTGWNVLTVGGNDDRGTASRNDDRHWYVSGSNGSSYVDPPGTAWNPHGDFNKPNLSAPAVGVRTANGLSATGTSVASPIVAGIAAQVLARAPGFSTWPEAMRAILMAGAIYHIRMPGGSIDAEHEGVGSASALWANRILTAGDGSYGGYAYGALSGTVSQAIHVAGGQRIKVVVSWNSRTSGSSNLAKSDVLASDLDLRVRLPGGAVVGSYTLDNNYEVVEFTSAVQGTATIEIVATRVGSGGERYGLAWSKVGGDTTPPRVTGRGPEAGEPWAPQGSRAAITFSEQVTGVTATTVSLAPAAGGSAIPAELTYLPSARRVLLDPSSALAPGSYRLSLGSGIRDLAGNHITAQSWTFSVVQSAVGGSSVIPSGGVVKFDAGNHVGFRFAADGSVVGRLSATLGSPSTARADRRALISGQPGRWLRIVNGIWAGYWIRESASSAIDGMSEQTELPGGLRIVFASGSHTGYRFDAGGRVTASLTRTLYSPSGASTSSRTVINGAWYLSVTDGIWAGYLVPETPRSYLPGMRDHRDLSGEQVRFAAGPHTGLRFAADGTVVATKAASLAAASGAPGMAWAIVNGAPRILIEAGVWSGYWVSESSRVQVP